MSGAFLFQGVKMQGPSHCPHCHVDLIGDPIPDSIRGHFLDQTNFKRELVVNYPDHFFGVWVFKCPDCIGRWEMREGDDLIKLRPRW